MNIKIATDEALRTLIRTSRQELQLRGSTGVDAFKAIKGQEHCKRALIVAAIQGHGVGIYGPHGSGKSMLVRAGDTLGVSVIEGLPCPCGSYTDPRLPCRCSVKAIERHQRKLRETVGQCDIHVECPAVPASELLSARHGTTSAMALEQIARAGRIGNESDRADGTDTVLKQAISELGLSAQTVSTVVSVAISIAALANQSRIGVDHILEAIHYRPLDRLMR